MNNYLRVGAAFVGTLFILATLSSVHAQDSTPFAADLALIQATKEARPVEFFPSPGVVVDIPFTAKVNTAESLEASTNIADWTVLVGEAPFEAGWEIVSARSDGQAFTRLTNNGWHDFRPAMNRLATRIVYTSEQNGTRDLYVMNADGSDVQPLTSGSSSNDFAAWMPGEEQILFSSNRGGNWAIYSMNVDGSNQNLLINTPGIDSIHPSVSPDGSKIAWVQREKGVGQVWVRFFVDTVAFPVGGSCNYMQNLRWISNDELLGDCDVDGDVMNEIFSISLAQPYFNVVANSGHPLTDTWAGGVFEATYYASWKGFHLANMNLSYVVEDGAVRIAEIWTEIPGLVPFPSTILTGVLMRSWQKTDWTPPTTSILDVRPVHFGYASGDVFQSYFIPFRLRITDIGAALNRVSVYYRVNGGSWQVGEAINLYEGWQEEHLLNTRIYGVQLGDQIDLLTIAQDVAGNVEDLHQKPWLSTAFYRGRLSGQVTDRMGRPLSGVTFSSDQLVAPVGQSDGDGMIRGYIKDTDSITVNIKHPAFAEQTITLNVPPLEAESVGVYKVVDTVFVEVLYHPMNFLNDGSFEQDQLIDWQSVPVIGTVLTKQHAFHGTQSLQWGQQPNPVAATYCRQSGAVSRNTQSRNTLSGDMQWRYADLTFDDTGYLHVIENGVYIKCLGADCGEEERVYDLPDSSSSAGSTVGTNGNTALVASQEIIDWQTAQLHLFERINGEWQTVFTASEMGFFGFADIHVTEDNDVYLVWAEKLLGPTYEIRLKYRERKDSVWSAPQLLHTFPPGEITDDPIRLSVNAKGSPHIFVVVDKLYEFQQNAAGTWSQPKVLYPGLLSYYDIAFDDEGTLHFAYTENNLLQYAKRAQTTLSVPESVAYLGEFSFVRPLLHVLQDGRVLILGNQDRLFVRDLTRGWAGEYETNIADFGFNISAISSTQHSLKISSWALSPTGYTYCLYEKAYARMPEQTVRSTIQRKFIVPQVLANPTLFFNANLKSSFYISETNRLFVEVDDGHALSRTLEVTAPTGGWGSYAVSLHDWKGQEITLTVGMDFVEGNESALVNLDAMQIASWETPEIRGVLIEQMPTGANTRIVITGDNFVDGTTLSLGDLPLQNMRVVSLQRIEADLAEFLPGIYAVTVTSPNGIAAVRHALIGIPLYLPLLSR